MKKWDKVIVIVLLMAVVLRLAALLGPNDIRPIGWWNRMSPSSVVGNYAEAIGIPKNEREIYDWCMDNYGKPDSVEVVEPEREEHGFYQIYLNYDKISFWFLAWDTDNFEDTSKWQLEKVTTRDPEHRFGLPGVHVCSPPWLVRLTYFWSSQINKHKRMDAIVDGYTWTDFVFYTYDEDNRVTSIEFIWGM